MGGKKPHYHRVGTAALIEQIVPKIGTSIDGIGFFLGAGSSYEAGYPLIAGLTHEVIGGLDSTHRSKLDDILGLSDQTYDPEKASPNIEEIADVIAAYAIQTRDAEAEALTQKLRALITANILDVKDPDLTHHVAFFDALKKRAQTQPARVFLFTPNYDLLIEEAAAETGVRIVNGFCGPIRRFWSEKEFGLERGRTDGKRFRADPSLTVVLIKLHGSISWISDGERIFEMDPSRMTDEVGRCMVLPRRTKVMETLGRPYDRLFTVAASILGSQCKHLLATGFSFGDEHINENLIYPNLRDGKINLTNFCMSEPSTLSADRERQNLTHICANESIKAGAVVSEQSDLWKFSAFANAF